MNARLRSLVMVLTLALSSGAGTGALAAGGGGDSSSPGRGGDLDDARTLITEERYEDALAKLERVVAGDEGNADAWNLIGFSLRKLGRYEPAMDGYARALAIDPRHLEAIEYLGELHLALGDLEEAEKQLARLGEICASGCDEYDELKEAIARYKAEKGG